MSEKQRDTREFYNQLSTGYGDLYAAEQALKHSRVIERLPARTGVLVDVGSGDGTFLERIKRRPRLAIGLDLSVEMVRLAKKKMRGDGRVDFVVADADHLPIPDNSVDTMVSISLAVEGAGTDRLLAEAYRIMRHGSKVVISLFHPGRSGPAAISVPDFRILENSPLIPGRESLLVLVRN